MAPTQLPKVELTPHRKDTQMDKGSIPTPLAAAPGDTKAEPSPFLGCKTGWEMDPDSDKAALFRDFVTKERRASYRFDYLPLPVIDQPGLFDHQSGHFDRQPGQKSILGPSPSPSARKLRPRTKRLPPKLTASNFDPSTSTPATSASQVHTDDAPAPSEIPHLLARNGRTLKLRPKRKNDPRGADSKSGSSSASLGSAKVQVGPEASQVSASPNPAKPFDPTMTNHDTVKLISAVPETTETSEISETPETSETSETTDPACSPIALSPSSTGDTSSPRPLNRRQGSLPSFNNPEGLHCPGRDELREQGRRASDPGLAPPTASVRGSLASHLRRYHSLPTVTGECSADNAAAQSSIEQTSPESSDHAAGDQPCVGTVSTYIRGMPRVRRSPSLDPVLEVDETQQVQPAWARDFEDFINNRQYTDDADTVEDDAEEEDSDEDVGAWTGLATGTLFAPAPRVALQNYFADCLAATSGRR